MTAMYMQLLLYNETLIEVHNDGGVHTTVVVQCTLIEMHNDGGVHTTVVVQCTLIEMHNDGGVHTTVFVRAWAENNLNTTGCVSGPGRAWAGPGHNKNIHTKHRL